MWMPLKDQGNTPHGTEIRMTAFPVQEGTDPVAVEAGLRNRHTPASSAEEEHGVNGAANDGENTPVAQRLRTKPDAR